MNQIAEFSALTFQGYEAGYQGDSLPSGSSERYAVGWRRGCVDRLRGHGRADATAAGAYIPPEITTDGYAPRTNLTTPGQVENRGLGRLASGAAGPVHIAWYLHKDTRINLMNYLRSTGLISQEHKAHSPRDMHMTLFYSQAVTLPPEHRRIIHFDEPVSFKGPFEVRTLHMGHRPRYHTPVAIVLPDIPRLRGRSDKLHRKLGRPRFDDNWIWHVTIARVQTRDMRLKRYTSLPPIGFALEFSTEETSLNMLED